jgi:outer membrane autotransporter protein
VQNVKARLAALRSGSPTSSLGGLSLVGPGGQVSLGTLTNALLGEGDQDIGADFDRWGWFATGSVGRGEADARGGAPAYDYDVNGITAGIDYRYRPNLIAGAALGYSKQDTDLADHQGSVAMTGWNLSAYGTYSFKDTWYLDGVVTAGRNRFTMKRRIAYTVPLPDGTTATIDQVATGHPDGDLFESALTFGGDYHKDAWSFGPYTRLIHTHMGFDAYDESMGSGPGSGLALAVDSRDVTQFTGVLGGKLAYTHSADWGILVPTASLEWEREFKDDPESLTARFLHDPTGTPIVVTNDPLDNQYFRLGLGMSLVLKHGRSGFVLYERMVGRDGMEQENLSLGVRVEF